MQKTSSQITIGIPFFNDSRYLDMAIRSVINQTYQDWLLLLVDDGSTDGSLEIAQKYAEKDNRISVISDGENKKLPHRLNQIAQLTKTPYLARMDADDIMHPLRLEKQLCVMESNDAIDVLGANVFSINKDNKIIAARYNVYEAISSVTGFVHPTIVGKTSWFITNPYDEKLPRSQDTFLWETTKHSSNFKRVNDPLLFYREVSGSYYKKYFLSSWACLKILVSKQKKYKKNFLFMRFFLSFVKGFIYFCISKISQEKILINRRNKGNISAIQISEAQKVLSRAINEK